MNIAKSQLEAYAIAAIRRFAPLVYLEARRAERYPRQFVHDRLVAVSGDIYSELASERSQLLIEIFRSLLPSNAVYDQAAKKELLEKLRIAAWSIRHGYVDYSSPPANTVDSTPEFEENHRAARADTVRGAESFRSYRRRLELSLLYQHLFLSVLLSRRARPTDRTAWHEKARKAIRDPFGEFALGLSRLGADKPLIERLDKLKLDASDFSKERDEAGTVRDNFIQAAIEQIVNQLDTLIDQDNANRLWQYRFEINGKQLLLEVEEQLQQFHVTGRCWVVSDAHLGLAGGNDVAFTEVLDACESGDRLILLGDILDFWIHLENQADLEKVVSAQWRRLYARLAMLRDRGVKVTYVPGNHDMFVFLLEGVGHVEWCHSLVVRCPSLARLHQELADHSLASVCEIVYPFMKLDFDGSSILLTHGHAHESMWHILAGNPIEDGMIAAFLQTTATILAYRFARQLRGLFNVAVNGPTNWVRYATDVSMAITNRHLRLFAERNVYLNTRQQRQQFVDELVSVFESSTSSAEAFEMLAIDTENAFVQLNSWNDAPVAHVRDATLEYMHNNPRGLNFQISTPASFQSRLSTSFFHEIAAFEQFVCGHYHMPRDQDPNFDSGCLLQPGPTTCLMVTSNGRIVRPLGVLD